MKSFGYVLSNNRNIGPGFDFLRVALALSIVYFHSFTVTNQYYPSGESSPFWVVHYILVPMFFSLSGFLVTASAGRLSLVNFLINRSFRIVPALAVDTFVCALIVGPLFTVMSLRGYFSDRELLSFFLNIVGYVHYNLPGVFLDLPVSRVNGSLWTVPFEIACYGLMSLIIFFDLLKSKWFSVILTLSYFFASVIVVYFNLNEHVADLRLRRVISVAFIEPEAQAVTAFLVGVIAFQFKDKIPYNKFIFFGSVVTLLMIAFTLTSTQGLQPGMRLVLMPIIVYLTIFIGLSNMRVPTFFKTGDYSYGIYLYHQPFLQIVIILFPRLAFAPHFGASFTFVAALPVIVGMAWLSWHLVEKPSLKLRKRWATGKPENTPRFQPVSVQRQ